MLLSFIVTVTALSRILAIDPTLHPQVCSLCITRPDGWKALRMGPKYPVPQFLEVPDVSILKYFQAGSTWCDGCGDNPDDFCLPYDGSKVPDCSQYVDPDHYLPYYHQHSSSEFLLCSAEKSQYVNFTPDCSRYWECGPAPAFEACLLECASCCGSQPPEECPGACQDWDGQFYQANFFDER